MANAHRASSMAGHLGAAVIAGYFLGEDHPNLDPEVYAAIERDLNRITGGEESIWFDSKKTGITARELFRPIPKADPEAGAPSTLARGLDANIGKLRQSGHNVIFASIAIRALTEHGHFASPVLVAGIGKLISTFDHQNPGRGYYGKAVGWKNGDKAPRADDGSTPTYDSLTGMAEATINQVIATASEHRRGFGGLFHLINHAAALTELDRFHHKKLARKGIAVHREHLRLYRALPDLSDELGRLESTTDDPFKPSYWKRTKSKQWGAWLTHRIKTLYGFHTLLHFIDDEDQKARAIERFGFLMA